ncbi:maleylpyruvate isomerase family mycothiol-dependent enzyme [Paractinoplanes atraurantiacus]|uniref:TIGR03083 family protein n=1 Tax=Paractinoplanes atraurantiacus TaxID=1036182 RepID=A0A285GXB0_9ACTN|nr:maleylpyruvate isomerase family mycothiol-dependent enzyme [Actinoplanes atraurantiacus]SNY28152.1 TIGR03083 family protein [Actinoplanes atraurantiacus]
MDEQTSWTVITEQRLVLADLLDGLTAAEWESPSLCAGWRIRDVAAHVATAPQPPGMAVMLGAAVRGRGSFNRVNHDMAVRHAARPPGEIVAELRRHASSRRLPAVTNYRNIVPDVLAHSQDVAIPLGRDLPMPVAAARAAAERVWTMGWPFWARRRLRGVRLTATDIDWSVGAGEPVTGPIAALVLLLTGRTEAARPHIAGPV